MCYNTKDEKFSFSNIQIGVILNLRLVSELWKDVGLFKGVDFTGYYRISSKGNLIGLDRTIMDKNGKEYHHKGCVMHPGFNKGYLTITLKKKRRKKKCAASSTCSDCISYQSKQIHYC